MLLKEICTPDVIVAKPEMSVLHAARMMREAHVGDLLVVDDDKEGDQTPLGIVTDRDIVLEVLGRELDPRTVTVREIMRAPVVIADESEESSMALERMKLHGVRRIPVMGHGGQLRGIVCLDDLLKQLASDAATIADIITREQHQEHRRRR
ncbi:MAG TPA: CBS domain-containing protein [Steroidobacteraceae bacterium]|nr:CBS domain-containing protein [Steroidobacteraceae bacterium]